MAIIFFAIFIVASSSAEAENSTTCSKSCGVGRFENVDYPFGFSEGCRIRLNCSENEVKIGEFRVQNITGNSIFVDLPAKCNRSIESIQRLFGLNYGLTWQNSLLLQKCSSQSQLTGCKIPTSMFEARVDLQGCDSKSDNISCYSVEKNVSESELLSYATVNRTDCRILFSSIAVVNKERNSGVFELNKVELGWWLEGPCNCSDDANCTKVLLDDGTFGFRCRCKDGFIGDGFASGEGCREISDCNSSNNIFGRCGTTRVGVLIGGIVAGASLMAGLALFCYVIRRRSSSIKSRMWGKRLLCEAAGNSSVPFYLYKEVERATNGFAEDQRLGTGAYGTVYAGKLHNDEWVAIKKIRNQDTESIELVMNEIKLLSTVSHPNLVRLLGCCIEKGEQILVYEYMPHGTLSQHLQRERGRGLPWTIRLTIASETAQAIAHLHSAMNPPIYHRDIKSSNILLDNNFNSKVADFGLSRLGMTETSHISTAPQGTPGYLDPQYHQDFHLSDKSDVYSFGVVLVEIITALKVVDFSRSHSEVNLASLAVDRIGRGCLDEIIDPFLEPNRDAWTLSSIHKVAELAFRCLAYHRDMRPPMMEVAEELEQIRLSGWAPMDENICMSSLSVASTCSSPFNGSEKSLGGMTVKKTVVGSRRLIVPHRPADCLASMEEVKDTSPVSVHDPWLSEQSSPSTNSLLGNVIR